jgi:hypothetical protein
MKPLLLVLGLVCAAIGAQAQTDDFAAQLRAGESINGFPSWSERVIHQWINRARVDPQAELAACSSCPDRGCYGPMPPLYWGESLNRSARFHAAEQLKQQYFGHDSKCTLVPNINSLYPVGCDGAASCACVGGARSCANGGCTPWSARVALFGAAPAAEIIAGTGDPNYAFYLWLYEPSSANACGYTTENGHRWIMLSSSGGVGVGVSSAQSVADFGSGGVPSKIASGSHYPQQAGSVDLWANWYDSNAPRSANVVVDGRCTNMTLKRGTPRNGAWSATANAVGSGCHRYYFSFVDASGVEVTWPATGSLGIGCADWDSSRQRASCSNTTQTPARKRSARH